MPTNFWNFDHPCGKRTKILHISSQHMIFQHQIRYWHDWTFQVLLLLGSIKQIRTRHLSRHMFSYSLFVFALNYCIKCWNEWTCYLWKTMILFPFVTFALHGSFFWKFFIPDYRNSKISSFWTCLAESGFYVIGLVCLSIHPSIKVLWFVIGHIKNSCFLFQRALLLESASRKTYFLFLWLWCIWH